MLIGTLGATLLGKMLAGKGILRLGYWSKGSSIKIFNFENTFDSTPMNLDLMDFIPEIICLKKRLGICNKSG